MAAVALIVAVRTSVALAVAGRISAALAWAAILPAAPTAAVITATIIAAARAWGGFGYGAVLGGLLAAPYALGPGYYAYPDGYEAPPDDAVAYCMRRFKSYDLGAAHI